MIPGALERFRRQPSPPEDAPDPNGFRLASTVEDPVAGQVEEAWGDHELPPDVVDLWTACGGARLFCDVDYGQWGLVLLSPSASAARTLQEHHDRPSEVRPDDIVLGEFLGDAELLLRAPSETGQRRVLIDLPLCGRTDWFAAAPDIGSFLMRYFDSAGVKYWEPFAPSSTEG